MRRVLILACVLASLPAAAFDTWWHNASTAGGTKACGFKGDAVNAAARLKVLELLLAGFGTVDASGMRYRF